LVRKESSGWWKKLSPHPIWSNNGGSPTPVILRGNCIPHFSKNRKMPAEKISEFVIPQAYWVVNSIVWMTCGLPDVVIVSTRFWKSLTRTRESNNGFKSGRWISSLSVWALGASTSESMSGIGKAWCHYYLSRIMSSFSAKPVKGSNDQLAIEQPEIYKIAMAIQASYNFYFFNFLIFNFLLL